MKENRTLNRIVGGVLTVAFLGFVMTAFVVMLVQHGGDIRQSVQMTGKMAATLPEDPTVGTEETAAERKAREDSVKNLEAENRILRARAEYWKGQTQQTTERLKHGNT